LRDFTGVFPTTRASTRGGTYDNTHHDGFHFLTAPSRAAISRAVAARAVAARAVRRARAMRDNFIARISRSARRRGRRSRDVAAAGYRVHTVWKN